MKIATLNLLDDKGPQMIPAPQNAIFQSVVMLSGVIQVNYSFDKANALQQPVEFRVVDNHEEYGNLYLYLGLIVTENRQVRHVLYLPSHGGPEVNPLQS